MAARRIEVRCPTCGRVRKLRPCDAKRAKQCRGCHLTQIAPLGWQATKAKYGEKVAVRHVQQFRRLNPSGLEQIVIEHLDALGVDYTREVWFETPRGKVYLIDFVLPGHRVIEVNGQWAHQFHPERDARKLAALEVAGFDVLALSEEQVKNGVVSALETFVEGAHATA